MLDAATRPPGTITLSAQSVEILLDLIEIKLSAMDIEDRDDRTIARLRRCRDELTMIDDAARAATAMKRRRGRPSRCDEARV